MCVGFPTVGTLSSSQQRLNDEIRDSQGLGNTLLAPKTTVIGTGPIECRERLGGLHRFYYREAA